MLIHSLINYVFTEYLFSYIIIKLNVIFVIIEKIGRNIKFFFSVRIKKLWFLYIYINKSQENFLYLVHIIKCFV